MKKNSSFKLKSGNKPSPAKLFGFGKSARQKRARRYQEEDREKMEEQRYNDQIVGYNR